MTFSYSRVECFKQCPYKYYLRYVKGLKTLPNLEPDNALLLGLGIHKGIETTPEQGVAEYQNNFYILSDQIVNWSKQIEYRTNQVKNLLPPNGRHEVEVKADNFVGYIDYLTDSIFDFKFTVPKNYTRYLDSKQLHLYKYYLEKQNPDIHVDKLSYVLIPKINIRQKKTESISQFRQRLDDEMSKVEPVIMSVTYDPQIVAQFEDDCKALETTTEYPKCESKLCNWCEYQPYCERGEDWMFV